MSKILFEKESYNIIGCCFRVHQELGDGFLEPVYQEALAIELEQQKIPFEQEKGLKLFYKNVPMQKKYFTDFICYDSIILEIKALTNLSPSHESQLINYLKATKLKLGILINFGETSLKYKRIII